MSGGGFIVILILAVIAWMGFSKGDRRRRTTWRTDDNSRSYGISNSFVDNSTFLPLADDPGESNCGSDSESGVDGSSDIDCANDDSGGFDSGSDDSGSSDSGGGDSTSE